MGWLEFDSFEGFASKTASLVSAADPMEEEN